MLHILGTDDITARYWANHTQVAWSYGHAYASDKLASRFWFFVYPIPIVIVGCLVCTLHLEWTPYRGLGPWTDFHMAEITPGMLSIDSYADYTP